MKKQFTFPARNKLPIASMRRPWTRMSFEIRIVIQGNITVYLYEETGLDLHSAIQLLTDLSLFDQCLVRTLITRH
jgi:hypothetical protein